jgi:5-methyltetrahydrofolate--homocysteine methyltransferase
MARDMGLSAAIINPHSEALMSAYRSYNALSGLDDGFKSYIASVTEAQAVQDSKDMDLGSAIVKGLSDLARSLTKEALKENKPLEVINVMIIPALDKVGEGFERKTIYLPGLLMAAEAAGAAFDVVKSSMPKDSSVMKSRVLLATVKGDIHDIGKNILKLILENYGYDVIDLGKDVSPEKIVKTAIEKSCDIVGISALMTTTLPAMEETVSLLKTSMPSCKIMVGGAVLTEDYANKIGADFYGKDAMEAVRWLENINNS